MVDAPQGSDLDLLAEAQATITRQADELGSACTAGSRTSGSPKSYGRARPRGSRRDDCLPVTHARLLQLIVETAADVIGARAGALFLVDEAHNELTFEVAIGPKAAEVKRIRLPHGQGVAGLVAVSGQPMAIADAGSDPRHARDIAQLIGYYPETILCVPLFYGDHLTGVLELLDKVALPPSALRT